MPCEFWFRNLLGGGKPSFRKCLSQEPYAGLLIFGTPLTLHCVREPDRRVLGKPLATSKNWVSHI
jgi:hypothetical protein